MALAGHHCVHRQKKPAGTTHRKNRATFEATAAERAQSEDQSADGAWRYPGRGGRITPGSRDETEAGGFYARTWRARRSLSRKLPQTEAEG